MESVINLTKKDLLLDVFLDGLTTAFRPVEFSEFRNDEWRHDAPLISVIFAFVLFAIMTQSKPKGLINVEYQINYAY